MLRLTWLHTVHVGGMLLFAYDNGEGCEYITVINVFSFLYAQDNSKGRGQM